MHIINCYCSNPWMDFPYILDSLLTSEELCYLSQTIPFILFAVLMCSFQMSRHAVFAIVPEIAEVALPVGPGYAHAFPRPHRRALHIAVKVLDVEIGVTLARALEVALIALEQSCSVNSRSIGCNVLGLISLWKHLWQRNSCHFICSCNIFLLFHFPRF